MISVADAIDRIAGARHERLPMADRIEVDDVLEAAVAWDAGELPIHEFAKVGTLISPGTQRPSAPYTRYIATMATPVTDGRRGPLLRALDALLRFQGFVVCTHGVFEPTDIIDIPIKIRKEQVA